MTATTGRVPLGGLTVEQWTYYQLARRFQVAVAKLAFDEFFTLALRFSDARVRRPGDEPLAWEFHDAPGNKVGHVYDLMRLTPRLWEQNVDNDELREWVLEAERLEKATCPEPVRKHPRKGR